MNILITGGAGFVGSAMAIKIKEKYPHYSICVVDNLVRRGSELNLPLLQNKNIIFKHADIRIAEDLVDLPPADVIIDASADPSILAGINSSTSDVTKFRNHFPQWHWKHNLESTLIEIQNAITST